MKILQINTEATMASPGRIACDLGNVIKKNGHDVRIAYGRGDNPNNIDCIKIGSNLDNYMHVLKTRVFDKHGFGSVNATKKFIEEVKKYDPDIIHLHNIHGYYINIELLFNYLKEVNKPVVWTLHDCWAFTGHCAYFDYIGCDKWKNGCYKCPQKEGYPTSKGMDNSKLNYEKKKKLFTSIKNMIIVTPSKWLANLVKESFLGKYPVEVINNGIDLEIFKPTKSNFRERYGLEDKFIVLGVASIWEERKGLKYFVELSEMLGDDYKIVVVGVNDKQKNGLPKNILAITRTNNVKGLAEIYTAVDVFVNPTLEDNFPTTNLEAIACGTPVITFDTGGSSECIDDKNGIVTKKNDITELYKSIHKIEKNSLEKYRNIQLYDLFNKEIMFNSYIQIYRTLKKVYL